MFKLIRRLYYNHLDKQEYKRYIKPKEKKPDIDTKQGLSNAIIYIAVTVLLLSILLGCIFIFGKKDGNKNKKVVSAESITNELTTKEIITESEVSSTEVLSEIMTEENTTEEITTEEITTETEATTEKITEETTKKKRKKKRKKRKQKEQDTQQESKHIIPLGNYSESNILNDDIVSMIKNSIKANISGRVNSELKELAEYMSSRKLSNATLIYNQLTNDEKNIKTSYVKVNIESDDDVSIMEAIEEIINRLPRVNESYGLSISSFRGNTVGYEIIVVLLQ